MWVARNKDGSFSISDYKLVRGHVSGTCPTDNDGNLIKDTWVCPDGSTPDIVLMNLIPDIKWEDEPIEVYLVPKENFDQFMADGKRNLRRVEENMRVLSNWVF